MDCGTFHFLFFVTIRVHPNGQALNSELLCEYVSNFHCTDKFDTYFSCSENSFDIHNHSKFMNPCIVLWLWKQPTRCNYTG